MSQVYIRQSQMYDMSGPTKDKRTFATEKDRKELSGTEKDLDMACYAIKTLVKLYIRMEYILLSIIFKGIY